jgi:hypothetical protein
MALPVMSGRTRVPGIKVHDSRMIRLMEYLVRSGTNGRSSGNSDAISDLTPKGK